VADADAQAQKPAEEVPEQTDTAAETKHDTEETTEEVTDQADAETQDESDEELGHEGDTDHADHNPSADHDPSVEEVADSLADAIESRGGVAPSSSPHLDEFPDAPPPEQEDTPNIEAVATTIQAGDPLDELIANLRKELDILKLQIDEENAKDKKKKKRGLRGE
jgi:hypothetical protein